MNTNFTRAKKEINTRPVIIVYLCLILFFSAKPVHGTTLASELKDLRVLNHYFTTAVCDGNKVLYVNDPAEARYLILKMTATLDKADGKLYVNDFALKYYHEDGKEDRAQCKAIGACETPDLGEYGEFVISNEAGYLNVERGLIYFELIFFIEDDVTTIELYRLGHNLPIIYSIGEERLFSVYISSNSGYETLSKARRVIEQGGYLVTSTSTALSEDEDDITIHYQEQAESQAREISQRMMITLGKTPKLEKMNLITQNDIVIWLGQ